MTHLFHVFKAMEHLDSYLTDISVLATPFSWNFGKAEIWVFYGLKVMGQAGHVTKIMC